MPQISRRRLLAGAIALAGIQVFGQIKPSRAARRQTVTVRSSEELLAAIAPDRRIRLQPGIYDLPSLAATHQSDYVEFSEVFDGVEAIIHDVENLELIGQKDFSARVLVRPRYAQVLRFDRCTNIELKRLEAGHWPDAGFCSGAVLQFNHCAQIEIEKNTLFGSGTYGIVAQHCSVLTCEDTTIQDCTYGIMVLKDSHDLAFEDCDFINNRQYVGVEVARSRQIDFEDCIFRNNLAGAEWGAFWSVEESEGIRVQDSIFEANESAKFMSEPGAVALEDVQFLNNRFVDLD